GAHDGNIAAGNALGGEARTVDHAVLPRTIFTDPQVAVVGLTDEEANARGFVCRCNTVPIHLVPRAGAVRDTRGIIKMVLEAASGKVLGVSMVGRDAGEVIHEAAMGMRFGATVHDFIDLVHVYPTMAEALKIVALSFFKDVSKLSCCAECRPRSRSGSAASAEAPPRASAEARAARPCWRVFSPSMGSWRRRWTTAESCCGSGS